MTAALFTRSKQQKALIFQRKLHSHGNWAETYIPIAYFAITGFGHYVLGLSSLAPFYTLQYAVKTQTSASTEVFTYGYGWRDIPILISLFFGWTLLRMIAMQHVLRPWAIKQGINSASKLDRFAEQSWQGIFYTASWIDGTWLVLTNLDWVDGLISWQNFPYVTISMQAKLHCLGILMFWALQLITVHTEQRRKDHNIMVGHHVVTIMLIAGCYLTHATPFIIIIAWCMDMSDVFLCMAKSANYVRWNTTADVLFGLFAISWFATRHGFYNIRWEPATGHYLFSSVYYFFYGLLLCLQIMCIYWSGLLIRVIIKKFSSKELEDCRSDDEMARHNDKLAK
ncbi:TLC domain-containing protein [Syncephalis fuscata]|nr:TLC domain-containing protein [Syncephalis fuscata]